MGKQQVKKQAWTSDDDALSLCDVRSELKKPFNAEDNIKYQDINKAIRAKMTTAKNKWFEEKCARLRRD